MKTRLLILFAFFAIGFQSTYAQKNSPTQPEDSVVYTWALYDTSNTKLDYVTRVASTEDNKLIIYGYKKDTAQKQFVFCHRTVALDYGEDLAIGELNYTNPFDSKHWQPIPLSLTAIPFKNRSTFTSKGKIINNPASSGITNIGFNLDLAKYQMDRYLVTGKKSTHKFSLGFWAAPSVEELDSVYTNGFLAKDVKSKQLFVSTGITISYSYNDIAFVFVPAGWDFGTTATGKQWVYNGARWWGFGIGISPKIFETILNK